jgi:hypothetical protein
MVIFYRYTVGHGIAASEGNILESGRLAVTETDEELPAI